MIDFPNNPIVGQVALSPDGTVWTWNGVAWVFQSTVTGNRGSVSGMVAYAQITANQGPITTEVSIVGLAVSPSLTAGRIYRVTAQIHHTVSISGDRVIMQIKDGATALNSAEAAISTAPNGNLYAEAIITATAGVHSFTVTAWRATGTGTVTVVAAPTMPSFIMVEDITFETVVAATASGGGGSGFTFTQDTLPVAAKQGDTWFNNGTGAGGGRSCVAVNEIPGNVNSELIWVQFAPGSGNPSNPNYAFGIVVMGTMVPMTSVAVAANTLTDITQAISFTPLAGRRYRIRANARANLSAAGARLIWSSTGTLLNGGDNYATLRADTHAALTIETIFDGTGVASTFKVQVTGPAALTVWTDSNTSFFYLEDVGPVR